jgi:hypothetical protein
VPLEQPGVNGRHQGIVATLPRGAVPISQQALHFNKILRKTIVDVSAVSLVVRRNLHTVV